MFTWITTAVVSNTVTAALQEKLDATYVQIAQYSVAIPALALAVSPLFWTPLAKSYGRRPIMIIGVFIAFISCVGAAVTKTYGGYMTARFFQGWGVGPASTVGLQVSRLDARSFVAIFKLGNFARFLRIYGTLAREVRKSDIGR